MDSRMTFHLDADESVMLCDGLMDWFGLLGIGQSVAAANYAYRERFAR
jgi:hypothetical protein